MGCTRPPNGIVVFLEILNQQCGVTDGDESDLQKPLILAAGPDALDRSV